MSIDKVKLYPFSPLKLLHETRKLTASQAKFFVALMCLYFEKYGELDWYNYGCGPQSGAAGAEEKNAAHYAPYCGVTKRTFLKMIDALQAAGVVYINDCGCITPVFAEEIQEAINEGTHQINTIGEYEAVVPVAKAKEKEGVAAFADDMFLQGDAKAIRGASGEGGGIQERDHGNSSGDTQGDGHINDDNALMKGLAENQEKNGDEVLKEFLQNVQEEVFPKALREYKERIEKLSAAATTEEERKDAFSITSAEMMLFGDMAKRAGEETSAYLVKKIHELERSQMTPAELAREDILNDLEYSSILQAKKELSKEEYGLFVDDYNSKIREFPWKSLSDEEKKDASLTALQAANNGLAARKQESGAGDVTPTV